MTPDIDPVEMRARNLTPAAYMQVVGIVQAFALGYLLLERGGERGATIANEGTHSLEAFFAAPLEPDAQLFALQFLAVLQLIVLVWYANAQHVMAFRLRAGVLDAAIPFSFALPEFFLIRYCDPSKFPEWCNALVGLTLVGIIAYAHMFWGLLRRAIKNKEHPEDKLVRTRVGALYPIFAVLVIGLAGVVASAFNPRPLF